MGTGAFERQLRQLRDGNQMLVDAKRQTWQAPGVTVVIVAGDDVQIVCSGAASLTSGKPVTETTTYPLGSLSKSLMSLAMCRAIPEESAYWRHALGSSTGHGLHDVLPSHLLSHSAGIPSYELFLAAHDSMSLTDISARLTHLPTIAAPGSRYLYSNLGYLAACHHTEMWLDEPWQKMFDRFLVEVLGRRISPDPLDLRTQPHTMIEGALRNADPHELEVAATLAPLRCDLWVDAREVADVLRTHLFGDTENGRVVEPGVLEFAQRGRVHTPTMGYPPDIDGTSYGFGWVVGTCYGRRMLAHAGFVGSTAAQFVLLPDEGIGVAVMLNSDNRRHYTIPTCCFRCSVAFEVIARLLGLPGIPGAAQEVPFQESPQSGQGAEPGETGDEYELSEIEGTYENPGLGRFTIRQKNGTTDWRYGAVKEHLRVHPKSRIVFASPAVTYPYPVSFRSRPDGLKVKVDPYVAAFDFQRV